MAAPGCRDHRVNGHSLKFCVDETGSTNVDVRLSTSSTSNLNWSMHLERFVNGKRTVIGTRDGFVRNNSASHRQFTGVGRQNASMRVTLLIAGQTLRSPTWTR
ncbi:hypothetical protein MKX54_11060 [Alkalihalobacillus sp. FSL R5-0424]